VEWQNAAQQNTEQQKAEQQKVETLFTCEGDMAKHAEGRVTRAKRGNVYYKGILIEGNMCEMSSFF